MKHTIIMTTAALVLLGACSAPITLTEKPAGGTNRPTEVVDVVTPTYPTQEPVQPSSEPVRGNPGNDKNVGRAGEQDKDEGSSGGTRGASTGKNKGENK